MIGFVNESGRNLEKIGDENKIQLFFIPLHP